LKCDVAFEWGHLTSVAVVSPEYFSVEEPINASQRRFYAADRPHREVVLEEHAGVVRALQDEGVEVVSISPTNGLPLQFNVRDAGIAIDQRLVLGRMTHPLRWPEPDRLVEALQVPDVIRLDQRLEGGDVTLAPGVAYVGLSQRTDEQGLKELRNHLGSTRRVVPIRLHPSTLHLDVAMTLVGPGLGIVHKPSIAGVLPESLMESEWLDITNEEYEQQAANVLVINRRVLIMDSRQTRLRTELEARDIRCVPVAISEISKIGGGIRCMTLPLVRSSQS
jgi:N-dimethylarginine dimethylaminohydrolase